MLKAMITNVDGPGWYTASDIVLQNKMMSERLAKGHFTIKFCL